MTVQPIPALPHTVSSADLLAVAQDETTPTRLPLGVGVDGAFVVADLAAHRNTLVCGPAGSGKSALLRHVALAALGAGHDLIIVEAEKRALDYAAFRPYAVAFADDISSAERVVTAMVDEMQRRLALLRERDAATVADLPEDVHVKPITVIIDEYAVSTTVEPIHRYLDRDDPWRIEAEERNRLKARIQMGVSRLVRQANHVGMHVVIGMQRPDSETLPATMRDHVTRKVQLVRPNTRPDRPMVHMVFGGQCAESVEETIGDLDDGTSKGFAVMLEESTGRVTGLRVAFTAHAEMSGLLERIGVPKADAFLVDTKTRGRMVFDASALTDPHGFSD